MNRSAKFLGLIGLLATGLLLAVVAHAPRGTSAAEGTTVGLLPGSQNVQLGDTVSIDVAVEDATGLAAFEFRVTYDPSVLKLNGITRTDFLASTGRPVTCPPIDEEAAKKITDAWFGCATLNTTAGPPVSGSGVLAHISFSAVGPGLTYLTFVKLQLADDLSEDCCGELSVSEAAVRVIAPDEPTPETLPPTPTRNPTALTPTPFSNAPTPSTWLTPEPGVTPMSRLVENARASGTTSGTSGNSGSQGTAGGSPRAGEGPSDKDPAWWPPLLAGLLAAAGASLLPLGLHMRGASAKRRSW
jgi:Cohesin domain